MDEGFMNEIEFSEGERAASYLQEAVERENQYSIHPELTEEAAIAAQNLIERFKRQLKKDAENTIDEVLGRYYSDLVFWIESDSWSNFRSQIVDAICNYPKFEEQAPYDGAKIRQAIFREYRDEIIEDLNQDNLKKIEELEKEVVRLRDHNQRFY